MIDRLIADGGHENMINVFKHDWLLNERYYIDMELCLFNLQHFIDEDVKSALGLSKYFDPGQSSDQNLQSLSMWSILTSISKGLEYIHRSGELHRDLKPQNGSF